MHTVFVRTLQDILPHLSKDTLFWRLHFIMGAITFGLRNPGPLRAYSKGKCDPEDMEMVFAQILPFAVSGFSAPEPEPPADSREKG